MKYSRDHNGNVFVENSRSKVRVQEHCRIKSPIAPGRVIKVLEVVEVLRCQAANPIERGQVLCLSFPATHVNLKEYEWYAKNKWEECQVNLIIKDKDFKPKQTYKEYRK